MPPRYSREIEQPIVIGDSLKEQFRTSPCEASCPAGNPIQKMQSLVEKGDFTEALRYLRAKNPFPGVTSRVCPRFCQSKCNRAHLEACVNTRALERAAADHALNGVASFVRRSDTGKHVSVLGGGPAGMTAAYFLSLLGHSVVVYESGPVLGGVPRYAVPNFRLPRDIVDLEVGRILEIGVRARLNTTVGKDISFAELRASSDAVIIATGTPQENGLPIPNADSALKAVAFLRAVALGQRPEVGKTVVIMGGGGVAFDCAFTARRLGASDVHVLCLEKEDAMRAPEEDLEQARREGIHIHTACTLSGIRRDKDRVSGVDYIDVQECRFDEWGRLSLVPVPGGEHSLACDTVIFAVGMKTDLSFLDGLDGAPERTLRNWIAVDERQRSSCEGIFAAGDVASGPASIAGAIGGGRRAAFAVHAYLTGEDARVYIIDKDGRIAASDHLAGKMPPYVVPFEEIYGVLQYETAQSQTQPLHDGLTFEEINEGYTPEQAQAEAARCFHCGHCKGCGTCVEDCPGYVLDLKHSESGDRPEVAFGDECWHCANCRTSCPCGAIGFAFPLHMQV